MVPLIRRNKGARPPAAAGKLERKTSLSVVIKFETKALLILLKRFASASRILFDGLDSKGNVGI